MIPTVYFNVPRGFDMLIAALRDDDELRRRFFGGVNFAVLCGRGAAANLWDALRGASIKTSRSLRCPMVSAWG